MAINCNFNSWENKNYFKTTVLRHYQRECKGYTLIDFLRHTEKH